MALSDDPSLVHTKTLLRCIGYALDSHAPDSTTLQTAQLALEELKRREQKKTARVEKVPRQKCKGQRLTKWNETLDCGNRTIHPSGLCHLHRKETDQ